MQSKVKTMHFAHVLVNKIEWYDKYARYVCISAFVSFFCALIVTVAFYKVSNRPTKLMSYEMDQHGRIITAKSLDEPVVLSDIAGDFDSILINWASERFKALNFLPFENYEFVLQDLENDFTESGYEDYYQQVTSSKIFKQVKENMYVKWAYPLDAPKILDKGVVDGVYTWRLLLRGMVNYQGGKDSQLINYEQYALMEVQRAEFSRNLLGIKISAFVIDNKKEIDKLMKRPMGRLYL